MSVLGNVVHTITGRGGESENPVIHEWEASEAAAFGFLGASGKVPEALVVAHPNVFKDRATWRTYHLQTGALLWAGELTEPRIEAGVAHLLGKGWGELLPEREVDGVYLQTRGAHPFEVHDVGSSVSTWNAAVGRDVQFSRTQDVSVITGTATVTALLRGAALYRLAFELNVIADSPAETRLIVYAGPSLGSLYIVADDLIDGSNDGDLYDLDLTTDTSAGAHAAAQVVRIRAGQGATTGGAQDNAIRIRLASMLLSGVPDGGDVTDGGLVRMASELIGVPALVDEVGISVLPFWPGAVTAGELLDRAMLFTGRACRFIDHGVGPVLVYGGWGEVTWTLHDPRQPTQVQEADRYDRIAVAVTTDEGEPYTETIKLIPSDLDQPRTFGPLDLPEHIFDAKDSGNLLDHLLQVVSAPRYTGDGHWAEVEDANGDVRSAHLVHAGDVAFHPTSGARLKVATLRRTESGVQPTFGDELETVLARVRTREMRRIRQRR